MKGRVKTYFEEKGYGFILGEDNKDYFFHISDVKSVEFIKRGQIVEFTPEEGNKGGVAKDIFIKTVPTSSKQFLACGDARIKISNIKGYGINTAPGFVNVPGAPYEFGLPKMELVDRKYFYVETYQNEKYKFFEDEVDFDIVEKCKELDEVLN